MRILTVHADYIEVEARTKAIKDAEEVTEKKMREDEVLVVFTSVEQGDEDVAAVAETLRKEIEKVANQIKVTNILLYPLVHLTSKPSAPRVALKVLQKAEELLKQNGLKCNHTPFGWYKGYTLKCKGHPLSELSRELKAGGDVGKIKEEGEAVSDSLKQEAEMKNRFYILDVDGTLHEPDKFNFTKYPDLKKFADYEIHKTRVYAEEPPHIKLMKEHSLVNYEPASDSGNFRWLPKGLLIKKLLERYVTDILVNYGANQVETPIMYDFEHPALKSYLNRFPARQYTLKSDNKSYFLRFSACFGQFISMHDMVITYKNLPFKIYELTHYSFRREQSGELAGLKRLRAFSMPDMHTLCADLEQSKEEFDRQFELCKNWNDELGLKFETAFRAQTDFFEENKNWYMSMVKKIGKPMLLEMFDKRFAYFVTKFEMNFIDNADKATALSTVQIDVENCERFDLSYVSEKNEKTRGPILHASIPGAIERVVYALLEREAMHMKQGKKPMFPIWLAPTQLRIIPVSDKHQEYAKKILNEMTVGKLRVDIDDKSETLGKKIRDAEKEWIPYIAVVGDNEIDSGKLSVSIRATGEKKEMSVQELVSLIEKNNEGKPFDKLSLSQFLGKRPIM
ncbi:MAG: threonine--tRNA ligase [Candidatus Micrarchaeota archaeon]|nr:threonine--tRNA ligase [Candidatus Micrarchaeota archaeon]